MAKTTTIRERMFVQDLVSWMVSGILGTIIRNKMHITNSKHASSTHFISYDVPWCPGHHPRQNIFIWQSQMKMAHRYLENTRKKNSKKKWPSLKVICFMTNQVKWYLPCCPQDLVRTRHEQTRSEWHRGEHISAKAPPKNCKSLFQHWCVCLWHHSDHVHSCLVCT